MGSLRESGILEVDLDLADRTGRVAMILDIQGMVLVSLILNVGLGRADRDREDRGILETNRCIAGGRLIHTGACHEVNGVAEE